MARSFVVERQLRGFHAVVIDPVYQVGTNLPSGHWILADGTWDDTGVWTDSANWNDA